MASDQLLLFKGETGKGVLLQKKVVQVIPQPVKLFQLRRDGSNVLMSGGKSLFALLDVPSAEPSKPRRRADLPTSFPLPLAARAPANHRCPEAWGSRPLGPAAELFIVDARAGFFGEEQLAWAAEAVEESRRTWKVRR